MSIKTYIPHLIFVLEVAYKYATRYSVELNQHLTSAQATCLTSTIAAIHDCLVLLNS
jgi:hypothetical protein